MSPPHIKQKAPGLSEINFSLRYHLLCRSCVGITGQRCTSGRHALGDSRDTTVGLYWTRAKGFQSASILIRVTMVALLGCSVTTPSMCCWYAITSGICATNCLLSCAFATRLGLDERVNIDIMLPNLLEIVWASTNSISIWYSLRYTLVSRGLSGLFWTKQSNEEIYATKVGTGTPCSSHGWQGTPNPTAVWTIRAWL